jgi:hypothetical protein
MFQGILILVVFLAIAALMALKKLPSLFALPILAVFVAIVAGLPLRGDEGIFDLVLVSGTTYLHETMLLILLACWLSSIMNKTGVTQTLIKKAAELGGDKGIIISLLLCAVTAFLFTTLFGTGAAMMVSAVVLPIMLSVGVPPKAAANLFLMSFGIGYSLNVANMSAVVETAGISNSDLTVPAIILAVAAGIFIVAYLLWIFRKGAKRVAFAAPIEEAKKEITELEESAKQVKGVRGVLACLTPLIIVLLTLIFKIPPIACFYIGVIWVILMTVDKNIKRYVNMLVTAFHDAGKDAAPPIGLCIGIGMALRAVGAPTTQAKIAPLMEAITPGTVLGLLIFAAVLAPLVLYRGPLNAYGLGAGLLVSMIALGHLSPVVLGIVFYALCRWANDGCPTSTVVVYASNFVGSDSVTVTNQIFHWRWIITVVTLVAIGLICFL